MDDERDEWERVGQTLDWVAGLVATRLDRDPGDLVWPAVVVGLVAGLGAEAVAAGAGSPRALTLVGVTLTVCGFGMIALLALRLRRGSGGGARTAEADLLAPWLRRLQVLLAAVAAAVVGLAVLGAVTGSVLLVARNVLELGRVGSVVLALSWLLMDGDVGLPDWLATRIPRSGSKEEPPVWGDRGFQAGTRGARRRPAGGEPWGRVPPPTRRPMGRRT